MTPNYSVLWSGLASLSLFLTICQLYNETYVTRRVTFGPNAQMTSQIKMTLK